MMTVGNVGSSSKTKMAAKENEGVSAVINSVLLEVELIPFLKPERAKMFVLFYQLDLVFPPYRDWLDPN